MSGLIKPKTIIWPESPKEPGEIAVFRKRFNLEAVPLCVSARIAVDSKYFLYVNGELIVAEGGLNRESRRGSGYYDEVDFTKALRVGENIIALLVWYYGAGGRDCVSSGLPGLFFACEALGIVSDRTFLCRLHPAYYEPDGPAPSGIFAGGNIGYDARREIEPFYALDSSEEGYAPAVEQDAAPWGELYKRPIPLHRIEERKILRPEVDDDGDYVVKLPYAMSFFPALRVKATGGERIEIRTGRFRVNGGPGDQDHEYLGNRAEYICKPGLNEWTSIGALFGERMEIRVSGPVEQLLIGYRQTPYDARLTGSFVSSDPNLNRVVMKAVRTLMVCMRDSWMDCPDRDRGQGLASVSVQVPQAAYFLDPRALKLGKKAIMDLLNFRRGDVLLTHVPGMDGLEVPGQSLLAIGEMGLIAQYVKYTGDESVLREAYQAMVNYLTLYRPDKDGLMKRREGNWCWYDHLLNIDEMALQNALYASALRFALHTAERIGEHSRVGFLTDRLRGLEEGFHRKYWRGKWFSSSDAFADDRANAWAVLAGLCPEAYYPKVRDVLMSAFNASVFMENFVLAALSEMGYVKDAYTRMRFRYYTMAVDEISTLREDFNLRGSLSCGASGAPATIAFKYFLGLDTDDGFKTYRVNPCYELFDEMTGRFLTPSGMTEIRVNGTKRSYSIRKVPE